MRLTDAEARRLGLIAPKARKAPKPRQRPQGYPPDVENGHTWQRDGRGFQCQQCPMWIPIRFMSLFAHGAWKKALEETTA